MVASLGLCLSIARAQPTEPAVGSEWRTALGGSVDETPHGVYELGWRRGPASVTFNTDTLDLRWSPDVEGGRWWVALRGEVGGAGLLFSPWRAGGPDRERSLKATYGGAEAGRAWTLPAHAWVAVEGATRTYLFAATDDTDPDVAAVPLTTQIVTPGLSAGWWSPFAQAYGRISVDLRTQGGSVVAPAAYGEVVSHPDWRVAPRFEVRAGVADGQDAVTRTRLGGPTPYAVPVLGSSWAEWWVEDFAAARGGVSLRWSGGHLSLLADAATFDGGRAEGFGLDLVHAWSPWRLEVAAGVAPWIPRQRHVGRWSAWARITREWGGF